MTYIPLSRAAQLAVAAVLIVFSGWVGHATFSHFHLQNVIASMDLKIFRSEVANKALMSEMDTMRNQFSEVAGTLERNHRKLNEILGKNDSLKNDLNRARSKLDRAERSRQETMQRHANLGNQLNNLEKQLVKVEDRNQQLSGKLKVTTSKLSEVRTQRKEIESARGWLKNHIEMLQRRIATLRNSQKNLLVRMTDKTLAEIKRIERVIVATGLKTDTLIRRSNRSLIGVGGPFVPLAVAGAKNSPPAKGVEKFDHHMLRLETLRQVVRGLPLVSPVDHYYIASKFGRRRDPFNKRWARHSGLDLAGNLRAPILNPAPGKVVFVGRKGPLGRTIVIDHGNGIRTRYGHLRRYYVKRGQKVIYRQKIGQLGNSGRSTGPHVHYEIQIDGKAVNPLKFLKAGKNVLKG